MTKKEYRKQRHDWTQALKNGRVLSYPPDRLTSYPTLQARDAALKVALQAGVKCVIVNP